MASNNSRAFARSVEEQVKLLVIEATARLDEIETSRTIARASLVAASRLLHGIEPEPAAPRLRLVERPNIAA